MSWQNARFLVLLDFGTPGQGICAGLQHKQIKNPHTDALMKVFEHLELMNLGVDRAAGWEHPWAGLLEAQKAEM